MTAERAEMKRTKLSPQMREMLREAGRQEWILVLHRRNRERTALALEKAGLLVPHQSRPMRMFSTEYTITPAGRAALADAGKEG